MARASAIQVGGVQVLAFLDMLALSEMGAGILGGSDDGYNVLVGSLPTHIVTFPSYAQHPNIKVDVAYHNSDTNEIEHVLSSAAGRYQDIHATWMENAAKVNAPDFSPVWQDIVNTQILRDSGALEYILQNDPIGAMRPIKNIWASLPGGSSGQHQNKLRDLISAYNEALLHYTAGNNGTPSFKNVISGVTSTAQGAPLE